MNKNYEHYEADENNIFVLLSNNDYCGDTEIIFSSRFPRAACDKRIIEYWINYHKEHDITEQFNFDDENDPDNNYVIWKLSSYIDFDKIKSFFKKCGYNIDDRAVEAWKLCKLVTIPKGKLFRFGWHFDDSKWEVEERDFIEFVDENLLTEKEIIQFISTEYGLIRA